MLSKHADSVIKLYYENSYKTNCSSVIMQVLLGRAKGKESKMVYGNPAKKSSGSTIFREM